MDREAATMLAFTFMTTTDQTARAVYEDAFRALGHKRRACAVRRRVIWADVLDVVTIALQFDEVYAARVRRAVAGAAPPATRPIRQVA
jgi:hypothetical protein